MTDSIIIDNFKIKDTEKYLYLRNRQYELEHVEKIKLNKLEWVSSDKPPDFNTLFINFNNLINIIHFKTFSWLNTCVIEKLKLEKNKITCDKIKILNYDLFLTYIKHYFDLELTLNNVTILKNSKEYFTASKLHYKNYDVELIKSRWGYNLENTAYKCVLSININEFLKTGNIHDFFRDQYIFIEKGILEFDWFNKIKEILHSINFIDVVLKLGLFRISINTLKYYYTGIFEAFDTFVWYDQIRIICFHSLSDSEEMEECSGKIIHKLSGDVNIFIDYYIFKEFCNLIRKRNIEFYDNFYFFNITLCFSDMIMIEKDEYKKNNSITIKAKNAVLKKDPIGIYSFRTERIEILDNVSKSHYSTFLTGKKIDSIMDNYLNIEWCVNQEGTIIRETKDFSHIKTYNIEWMTVNTSSFRTYLHHKTLNYIYDICLLISPFFIIKDLLIEEFDVEYDRRSSDTFKPTVKRKIIKLKDIRLNNIVNISSIFDLLKIKKSLYFEAISTFPIRNVANISSSLINLAKNPVLITLKEGDINSTVSSIIKEGENASRTIAGETLDVLATLSGAVLPRGTARSDDEKRNRVQYSFWNMRNIFENMRDRIYPECSDGSKY